MRSLGFAIIRRSTDSTGGNRVPLFLLLGTILIWFIPHTMHLRSIPWFFWPLMFSLSLGILGGATWLLEHLPVRIQQFAERWALFPDVLDPVRNGTSGLWIILTYLWVILGWATMIGRIVWL